jgi:L-rhamnose mutarotase
MKVTMLLGVLGMIIAMCGCTTAPVQRFGAIIGIKKEAIPEYTKLHANPWPGVLKMIHNSNIRNYSIYLSEIEPDQYCLFSYYEYTGGNFTKDMDKMAADKTTQEWWNVTKPLQAPLATRKQGEWWSTWQEVFHYQGPPTPVCMNPRRLGSVIGIPKKSILAYTQLHAAPWPGVIAAIEKANIRNYSIYIGQIKPDEYYLFSYFEYVGTDFDKDMAEIDKDPTSIEWWKYTDPLQKPLSIAKPGEQWHSMDEVFHTN